MFLSGFGFLRWKDSEKRDKGQFAGNHLCFGVSGLAKGLLIWKGGLEDPDKCL